MASDRPIALRLPHDLRDEIARRVSDPSARAEGKTAADRRGDDARGGTSPDREYTQSQAIRAAMARYYEMCARHLKRLDLSRGELGVLCEALNGGLLAYDFDGAGAARLSVVWAELADTVNLHPGYGKRWGLDDEAVRALATRLSAAPYADLCAVVDFVERFWAGDEPAQKVIYPDD